MHSQPPHEGDALFLGFVLFLASDTMGSGVMNFTAGKFAR